MILTCPACATRYVVDPAALGLLGRTVKCVRCADTWFQSPPPETTPSPPAPLLVSVVEPVVTPSLAADGSPAAPAEPMPSFIGSRTRFDPPKLPALRKPPAMITAVQLGWAGLALVVLLFLGGLFQFRTVITASWPATQRLYDVFGLNIDNWLKPRNPQLAYTTVDGQARVVVTGEVANISSAPRAMPPLRVTLRDAHAAIVSSWVFTAPGDMLNPGQAVAFRTENPAPTGAVASLNLSWVTE